MRKGTKVMLWSVGIVIGFVAFVLIASEFLPEIEPTSKKVTKTVTVKKPVPKQDEIVKPKVKRAINLRSIMADQLDSGNWHITCVVQNYMKKDWTGFVSCKIVNGKGDVLIDVTKDSWLEAIIPAGAIEGFTVLLPKEKIKGTRRVKVVWRLGFYEFEQIVIV